MWPRRAQPIAERVVVVGPFIRGCYFSLSRSRIPLIFDSVFFFFGNEANVDFFFIIGGIGGSNTKIYDRHEIKSELFYYTRIEQYHEQLQIYMLECFFEFYRKKKKIQTIFYNMKFYTRGFFENFPVKNRLLI